MISIVIPVRNNIVQLHECLEGFVSQDSPPTFEVVVVDDGSEHPIESELSRGDSFPVKIVRQVPLGISAARNRGLLQADGDVILFVDSDVVLYPDFLRRLADSIAEHPEDMAFQPSLEGGDKTIVQRMEGLRLKATLAELVDEGGYVNYVNTSAFAVRKSFIDPECDFFYSSAVRGEDTYILINLLKKALKPRYITSAKAVHITNVTLFKYIRKHFKMGYYTTPAREALKSQCPEVLMENSGRRKIFAKIFSEAGKSSRDWLALGFILIAYSFERLGRVFHKFFGMTTERRTILSLPVDSLRESDLLSRIVNGADRKQGMLITYLTAWTLVQAKQDRSIGPLFHGIDICYSDGLGLSFLQC